jgi:putative membrane protein
VVFGLVVAPGALLVLLLARRRYRRSHEALQAARALPDGKLPGLVALVTLLLAALEIAYAIG